MGCSSIRRRELLLAGGTLITSRSGCATTDDTQDRSIESPPLIGITIVNEDFESYDCYLLIQSNGGEIHSWNTYELPAATESDGVKTAQSIEVGTARLCLAEFLVSASIDGGDSWAQIDAQTYVQEREEAPENQGAAPEGEIRDGELTLRPQLDNILGGQCSNGTRNSETTTDTASRELGY